MCETSSNGQNAPPLKQEAARTAAGLPEPPQYEPDADYEAAEEEHDRRDHVMWLNGFKSAAWEVTRAELRAADIRNLRNIACGIFGLDSASMSRTAMIGYILAHKEEYRW